MSWCGNQPYSEPKTPTFEDIASAVPKNIAADFSAPKTPEFQAYRSKTKPDKNEKKQPLHTVDSNIKNGAVSTMTSSSVRPKEGMNNCVEKAATSGAVSVQKFDSKLEFLREKEAILKQKLENQKVGTNLLKQLLY